MPKTDTRRRLLQRGIQLGGFLAVPAVAEAQTAAAPRRPAPANETLKVIESLRTIHGDFTEARVPDDKLDTILDAAVRAANASNMQSYSIVVSREPDKIMKLTGYRGPCLLLFCADHTRIADVARRLGRPFNGAGMDSFVTSSTNTILAAQTAAIAAKSLGIGSMFTNGIHRGDMERVWDLLGLPQQSCVPLIALILGFPKSEPPYRTGRLRGPGIVHYERYQRLDEKQMDEIIRQHDDPSQHLGLNDDWRKSYKHYLDWFYADWLGRFKPAPGEGPMFRRLKKSGYIDGQSG